LLAEQQLPDQQRNNQQRQSGSRFADRGQNQYLSHRPDNYWSFVLALRLTIAGSYQGLASA